MTDPDGSRRCASQMTARSWLVYSEAAMLTRREAMILEGIEPDDCVAPSPQLETRARSRLVARRQAAKRSLIRRSRRMPLPRPPDLGEAS